MERPTQPAPDCSVSRISAGPETSGFVSKPLARVIRTGPWSPYPGELRTKLNVAPALPWVHEHSVVVAEVGVATTFTTAGQALLPVLVKGLSAVQPGKRTLTFVATHSDPLS